MTPERGLPGPSPALPPILHLVVGVCLAMLLSGSASCNTGEPPEGPPEGQGSAEPAASPDTISPAATDGGPDEAATAPCPDPDDPAVRYVAETPERCRVIRFACEPGTDYFGGEGCGCGCIDRIGCRAAAPRARVTHLAYPHHNCEAARQDAEGEAALANQAYRDACLAAHGDEVALEGPVALARVTECRPTHEGVEVDVALCCAP